jgi:hypothetical protein
VAAMNDTPEAEQIDEIRPVGQTQPLNGLPPYGSASSLQSSALDGECPGCGEPGLPHRPEYCPGRKHSAEMVEALVLAAHRFEVAAADEIDRLLDLLPERPHPVCPGDPCEFCAATGELHDAIADITDPGWRTA